jgi:REP element-mobilizing transposase RayT
MSTPKHRTAPGTSYFVTTKCHQGRTVFQTPEVAQVLVQTLFCYRERSAYLLHEFVAMPDHFHLLLTPGATTSLEKAIGMIKGGSSHRIHKERDHKMEIWQQGFYDWAIRDEEDWRIKAEYIRMNPVRAKFVDRAEDWLYSSARNEFILDPKPIKYCQAPSGAKAPLSPTPMPGLKPRPPKEPRA